MERIIAVGRSCSREAEGWESSEGEAPLGAATQTCLFWCGEPRGRSLGPGEQEARAKRQSGGPRLIVPLPRAAIPMLILQGNPQVLSSRHTYQFLLHKQTQQNIRKRFDWLATFCYIA